MQKLRKIAKTAVAPTGETFIEIILTDLYNRVKQAVGQQIKLWHIRKLASSLYRQVHKIRLVKTLWQVDKAVDLKQFYCDSHLILAGKRRLVCTLADLGDRKRVLITGIAGQGKSILLRYVCSNTLSAGDCIPAFVELRRVLPGESLIDHIQRFFELIGIPCLDDVTLKALLGSGKIVLFLDGFDEVAETDKPSMIHEIEHLALTFDDLRIVVTSRPESGLEVSPLLEVVRLSNLENGEYKKVIYKLTDDTGFAEGLIKQIEAHKSKLHELLCTPLLVTLLVMSYKSFQELPEQLSEFYDSIFQVLLQRHDGAKPGFKRPRRCSFNDNQYRSVFEALCYESKRKIKSIFKYEDVQEFAKTALMKSRLNDDPDKYIQDIIKVTCLILHEGEEYRFIHRSVQEYYAAAFIKHRSEPVARRFYEQMVAQGPHGTWAEELRFLSEIDRYRYNKYFLLPHLCRILDCPVSNIPKEAPAADIAQTLRLLGDIWLGFGPGADVPLTCRSMTITQFVSFKYVDRIFRLDYSTVFKAIDDKLMVFQENPVKGLRKLHGDERYYVSVAQVLDADLLTAELLTIAGSVLSDAHAQAINTAEMITVEESVDINLSLEIE